MVIPEHGIEASNAQGSEILALQLIVWSRNQKAQLPLWATLFMVLYTHCPDFFNISLGYPHIPLVSKMLASQLWGMTHTAASPQRDPICPTNLSICALLNCLSSPLVFTELTVISSYLNSYSPSWDWRLGETAHSIQLPGSVTYGYTVGPPANFWVPIFPPESHIILPDSH